MLLLVTALVIFNFLEGILRPPLPTPLPAMTRAEITPSASWVCQTLNAMTYGMVMWNGVWPEERKQQRETRDTVYCYISAKHNPSSRRNFLSPAQFSQWLSLFFFWKINMNYFFFKPERFMEQQGMGFVAPSTPLLSLRKKRTHPCTSPSHAPKTIWLFQGI